MIVTCELRDYYQKCYDSWQVEECWLIDTCVKNKIQSMIKKHIHITDYAA